MKEEEAQEIKERAEKLLKLMNKFPGKSGLVWVSTIMTVLLHIFRENNISVEEIQQDFSDLVEFYKKMMEKK